MQINLQHSRTATDNLMKLIQQDLTDIAFVQEPYIIQNKIAGITIIIANEDIDAIIIKQLCDRDTIVAEVRYKSMRFLAASMYFDNRGYKLQHSKNRGNTKIRYGDRHINCH